MIRYALKCPDEHSFESWFQSADAFESLRTAGHLACPECGSTEIAKALMAPPVQATGKTALTKPKGDKEVKLAELKAHVERNSEYVGMNFATEARAIHDGSSPERSIYGEAKPDDARSLIEDGVPVAPLPFVPARRAN